MTARAWRRLAACALAAVCAACGGGDGGEETAPAAGEPVVHPAPGSSAAVKRAGNQPPVVHRVTIEPRDPASGENVTAIVEAEDPNGDEISFQYEWRIKGRAAGADEPRLLLLGASRSDAVEVVVTPRDPGRRARRRGRACACATARRSPWRSTSSRPARSWAVTTSWCAPRRAMSTATRSASATAGP
jgi:hypothetical protein